MSIHNLQLVSQVCLCGQHCSSTQAGSGGTWTRPEIDMSVLAAGCCVNGRLGGRRDWQTAAACWSAGGGRAAMYLNTRSSIRDGNLTGGSGRCCATGQDAAGGSVGVEAAGHGGLGSKSQSGHGRAGASSNAATQSYRVGNDPSADAEPSPGPAAARARAAHG